jgi:PqqD family protein of HPr-rel-A system
MAHYARVDGVIVEPMGHLWAAFSPLTGETVLLNDESAAMLEVLQDGPGDSDSLSTALAADSDADRVVVRDLIDNSWYHLISAGLVRERRVVPPARV